jgi:hypothetical protein
MIAQVKHLSEALKEWAKAGLPLASKPLREDRLKICAACSYWSPRGNFGLGQCTAGCGCTKFKAYLLTETCPHPGGDKWAALKSRGQTGQF